ncbi:MAG: MFS transporter [Armatimonadota bacterium]
MTEDQLFHKSELNRIKSSITKSYYEAACSSTTVGVGETLLGAFAVALNFSAAQLGVLLSLPNLIGSLFQTIIPEVIEKLKQRKIIFVVFSALASAAWILILLTPFIFKTDPFVPLIIFVSFYYINNNFIISSYTSTISSWIPEKLRGNVLGRRQRILTFALLISTLTGAFLLKYFKQDYIFYGFALVFFIAATAKFISYLILKTVYEPKMYERKFQSFSFPDFVKKMLFNNFGRFTLYIFFVYFAIYLSAPYFVLYMIRDLGFTYFQYIFLIAIAATTNFLTTRAWGRFADKHGNMQVLKITGLLISLTSFVWLFSPNFYYLIFAQVFSGLIWSGFNLSSINFIYDSTTPERRARCVSYYNIFWNLGIFTGAVTGSFLLKFFPNFIWFGSALPVLFFISSILRFLVTFIFAYILKEIRRVRPADKVQVIIGITGLRVIQSTFLGTAGVLKYGTSKILDYEIYLDKITEFVKSHIPFKKHK